MKTTVHMRGPTQFDINGRGYSILRETEESISPGLASRLESYARKRVVDAGLPALLEGWTVEIYTTDGELPPSERYYVVKWQNTQGTEIQLTGILTNRGWPTVDHGFSF